MRALALRGAAIGLAWGWCAASALAAEGEGGHAPSPFAGDIGNVILTLIIFGAVVLILGSTAWPSLIRVLNEREQSIRDSLEQARRQRVEAEELLERHRQQMDAARAEASAIVDEGRRDAEEVRRRIQEDARRESDEMVARARREIQLATDAAVHALHDQTVELAVRVAKSIVAKELSPDDHRRLVDESLARMKSQGSMN